MKNAIVDDLLQLKGLKKTKLRTSLLEVFLNTKHAQSYVAIMAELGDMVDKSTLYRNLSAFEEAEIIHRITDDNGVSKYAFGPWQDHTGNHAHFFCEKCDNVYCVEGENPVNISVPEGFKKKNVQTIIRGTCPDC